MIHLLIESLPTTLSPRAKFHVLREGQVVYRVTEYSPNLFRKLLGFTKLRMPFPLRMEILDLTTGKSFELSRGFSLLLHTYKVSLGENLLFSFKPQKIYWRGLSFSLTYDISDQYGEVIGICIFSRVPKLFEGVRKISTQYGEVKDRAGNVLSSFEWKGFSLLKGYTKCDLTLNSPCENWVIISIVAAIIKALYQQKR